jgi:hypothetical protein
MFPFRKNDLQRLLKEPSDEGIQPQPGDDTSPPNALKAPNLNSLCSQLVCNVGFSSHPQVDNALPSALCYDVELTREATGEFGLATTLTLEFSNPYAREGESMVVHLKRAKQYMSEEGDVTLDLLETRFQDFADGQWVDISTNIKYSEEATAIVQSVIESDSGQTAGLVKISNDAEEAKLGPVGEKG